jgi:hypothetical protein
MMINADPKPRTGLDTSTGKRDTPRMAGGMPRSQINSFELPSGTLQERLDALMKKAKEDEEFAQKTLRNKNRVGAGESPTQDVGGSIPVLDATIERMRTANLQMGSDTNRLLTEKGMADNNVAANAKARGLGQYNGISAGTISYGGYNSEFQQRNALQAAADDAAAAAKLEAQRNNNRIAAKTAADAAAAADNAYSQRYAAAQAADAQKFASTMQMFGNITQPGAYKYWGG